jgi:hypothetical protein
MRILALIVLFISVAGSLAGGDSTFDALRARHLRTVAKPDALPAARLAALEWLGKHVRDPADGETIAALDQCLKDAEAKVRAAAVEARGNLAMQIKAPCPIGVIEAMLDSDPDVRENAINWSAVFPSGRYAQDAAPVLLRCVKSDHHGVRSLGVLLLAQLPNKNDTILRTVTELTRDKHVLVRNDAQSALYRLTGKLDDVVPYCLRLRLEARDAARIQSGKVPAEERVQRNLVTLGVNLRLSNLIEDRTDDLAQYLLGLLAGEDATLRRATAIFLADRYRGPAQPPKAGAVDFPYSEYFPHTAFDDPEVQRKQREASAKKHAAFNQRLEELGVEKRLRRLRDADPEALVRGAAAEAVSQWEAYRKKKPNTP